MKVLILFFTSLLVGPASAAEIEPKVPGKLAGHTHKLVVNEYKGIQLVNGETTSKNFDKRPMGFRWWDVATKGKMVHRFVALEGMDE